MTNYFDGISPIDIVEPGLAKLDHSRLRFSSSPFDSFHSFVLPVRASSIMNASKCQDFFGFRYGRTCRWCGVVVLVSRRSWVWTGSMKNKGVLGRLSFLRWVAPAFRGRIFHPGSNMNMNIV